MSFQLTIADIDPSKITFSKESTLDFTNSRFIYEHLRYHCSKFFPIPSISVEVRKNSIVVVDREIYLMIAKDLNLPAIRAVIDGSSDESAIRELAEKGEIKLLDYAKLRFEEKAIDYGCHTLFFERELTKNEQQVFKEIVVNQFNDQNYLTESEKKRVITFFTFSHAGKCAELEALTPVENYQWANTFREKLIQFHSKIVKIVSYQGSRFIV